MSSDENRGKVQRTDRWGIDTAGVEVHGVVHVVPRYLIPNLVFAFAAAFLAAWPTAAADLEPLWISDSRLGAALLRVDPATGARSLIDLYDYPRVIDVRGGVVSPAGEVYLEAINALSLSTVVRLDPKTGRVVGISGFVDPYSALPRGSGPGFEPGLTGMVGGPWGLLFVLRRAAGPMAVDIATGDRAVISQSVDPPVGSGVDLTDPLDLIVERGGSLLVADRFEGLVRVAPVGGSRRVASGFDDLVEGPHRIERLPDGRVLHAFGSGDGRLVSVLDRKLHGATEFSGGARGSGPDFVGIVDFMATADGSIYVLDLGLNAVVAVDVSSGDRRIVADDPVAADLGLLSLEARLLGRTAPNVAAPRRAASRRGVR